MNIFWFEPLYLSNRTNNLQKIDFLWFWPYRILLIDFFENLQEYFFPTNLILIINNKKNAKIFYKLNILAFFLIFKREMKKNAKILNL